MKGPWVNNLGYRKLGKCIKIMEQKSLYVALLWDGCNVMQLPSTVIYSVQQVPKI